MPNKIAERERRVYSQTPLPTDNKADSNDKELILRLDCSCLSKRGVS